MKTKITTIGILLCVVAACNVSNSNKKEPFDPHSLDGVYRFVYHKDVPAPDSLCEYSGCTDQKWYRNYIQVDYPDIQACAGRGQVVLHKPFGKEDVTVALKKDSLFEVNKINGHVATNNDVIYKITKDSSHFEEGITDYLYFQEIKNGKKHYTITFKNFSRDSADINKEYQQCISQAPDTTGIFPSTQRTAVKPN